MADAIINENYTFWITGLQDLAGDVLTGASWDVTLCRKTDGTTSFTPAIAESVDVPGDYLVTIPAPNVLGLWVFRGIPDAIDELKISYQFEVSSAASASFVFPIRS